MPGKEWDVASHMKGLSTGETETWVEVADKALAACEKAGKADCDASAIKQANAVLGKVREAFTPEEEEFVEAASFKAILARFMKSARVLADHAFISKAVKKRLAGLQDALKADHGAEVPADATEATGDTSDGAEEFRETGELLEVTDG